VKFFKKKQDPVASSEAEDVLDVHAISRLMRHFPVGGKLQYYPEYKKDILLDTVAIAYLINNNYIYSAANLKVEGNPGQLEFDDQDKHYAFKKISHFRIVLPVHSESEAKLDYIRREELHKIGGLVKNNVITLMAQQEGGQVPVLETLVEKRTILKDGFYANQTVAILDVDIGSLMLSDQRAHLRLNTNIPATIQVNKKGEYALLNCMMLDFCDRSLRLQVDDDFADAAMPRQRGKVIVSFNLPGQSEYISLVGEVFRIVDKSMVIMLSGAVEKGQEVALGQIELLKIKANLLQHSGTHLSR